MTDNVFKTAQPAKPQAQPAAKRERKPLRVQYIDWSWVIWLFSFFLLPSIIRLLSHLPVSWLVTSYWELGSLGGETQAVANRILGFADFYARTTITYIMLIVLLFMLIYLVLYKRIDVRKWGLTYGNIIPGIALFGLIWVFVYFLYVPYASAFSGANFYIGMPLPPKSPVILPFSTYGSFGEMLELMFMPKNYPVYLLSPQMASPFETNYLMGFLDFFRVWFLNAPILFSMTWGFFYNSLKEKLGVIMENAGWKNYGKLFSIFFLTLISIPVMQSIYRVFDEMLSHQVENANIANATAAEPKIISLSEPYYFLIALGLALVLNILAGSSLRKERVKDTVSNGIKLAFTIILAVLFIYVLFTGESSMPSIAFTVVSGLLGVMLAISIAWVVFDPHEDSTALGFSELSKWMPGTLIMLIATGLMVIFKAFGMSQVMTVPMVLTVAFWLVAAFIGNYLYNWLFVEPIADTLGDWGKSLVKWVPGAAVFIVGFTLSALSGWHTAPGIYGPFSNQFGIFSAILLCGWIYVRTQNLVATFLMYSSLPWFLNFIQIDAFQVPTLAGSVSTGVFVLLAVLVLIESYRLWAPYITWQLDFVRKEPEAENTDLLETSATN